jgi:hypothetical protein
VGLVEWLCLGGTETFHASHDSREMPPRFRTGHQVNPQASIRGAQDPSVALVTLGSGFFQ